MRWAHPCRRLSGGGFLRCVRLWARFLQLCGTPSNQVWKGFDSLPAIAANADTAAPEAKQFAVPKQAYKSTIATRFGSKMRGCGRALITPVCLHTLPCALIPSLCPYTTLVPSYPPCALIPPLCPHTTLFTALDRTTLCACSHHPCTHPWSAPSGYPVYFGWFWATSHFVFGFVSRVVSSIKSAVPFIETMLQLDPERRPTAEKVGTGSLLRPLISMFRSPWRLFCWKIRVSGHTSDLPLLTPENDPISTTI